MPSPHKTIGLLLGLLLATCGAAHAEVKISQPFPALASYPLSGALPDTTGRVVLIDFWASWCAPCRQAFPPYSALQQELGPRGLTIIAISVDEQAKPYDAFVTKFKPAFTTLRDSGQRLATEVRVPAMPTSYLIDRHGIVRYIHPGFHGEETLRELRRELTTLLEEKP